MNKMRTVYQINSLRRELAAIYEPVGVSWNTGVENFTYSGDTDNFFDKNSGLLSAYNAKMTALQRAYLDAKGGIDKNACYVFILNDSGDGKNRDAAGFMPRGKQFAYIFKKNIDKKDVEKVIAHELGHGQWKLRHIFDATYGSTAVSMQGKTANLMDYGNGTHLAKWQWDIMSQPAIFDGVFDSDEDAMAKGTYTIEFTPTSKFVQMDTVRHKNFIEKYTTAYKNYQNNYNKDDERLLNQYLNITINEKTYRTNSVATIFGRDFGNAFLGRFQGVFEIDNHLEIIIAQSLFVFQSFCNSQSKEQCVLGNSVGKYNDGYTKLLDYKFELYKILQDYGLKSNDLVAIDGIVYNANEIGNYIWAMILTYNGVFISPNLIAQLATQAESWFKRDDEPWEQKALDRGQAKASKLSLDNDEIIRQRQEIIFFYNNKWISLSPFNN